MVTPAPPHAGPATIATKDLTLGIVSGILTHMILRDV